MRVIVGQPLVIPKYDEIPVTVIRNNIKNAMSEIVNQSLQKIAKGTGIIFVGTMGLGKGSTRHIAYFRGKKEEKVFKCKEKIAFWR